MYIWNYGDLNQRSDVLLHFNELLLVTIPIVRLLYNKSHCVSHNIYNISLHPWKKWPQIWVWFISPMNVFISSSKGAKNVFVPKMNIWNTSYKKKMH